MINTFVESYLEENNRAFLNSVLSNGISICIWTYDVNSLKKQVPFGVKVKNAEEIVPKIFMLEMKRILLNEFINYFKFVYLQHYGGCFINPTIILLNIKLINELENFQDLIFGDGDYSNYLNYNRLPMEAFEDIIQVSSKKTNFAKEMLSNIEESIFYKKNTTQFFKSMYNIKYRNKIAPFGNLFYRSLCDTAVQYGFKLCGNNQISLECEYDILYSGNNIKKNLTLLIENLYYLDIKRFNFKNLRELPILLTLLLQSEKIKNF